MDQDSFSIGSSYVSEHHADCFHYAIVNSCSCLADWSVFECYDLWDKFWNMEGVWIFSDTDVEFAHAMNRTGFSSLLLSPPNFRALSCTECLRGFPFMYALRPGSQSHESLSTWLHPTRIFIRIPYVHCFCIYHDWKLLNYVRRLLKSLNLLSVAHLARQRSFFLYHASYQPSRIVYHDPYTMRR
ncbi:hypothetical protein BDR04DRAFT_335349 [Suillus decipiens]|nr:hypothetical protein BDR04DRAFT_335349 [Suillus decipiens]